MRARSQVWIITMSVLVSTDLNISAGVVRIPDGLNISYTGCQQ